MSHLVTPDGTINKATISIVENRDCMEAMKEFPDKFFDLAIVDPPYGVGNWVQVTGDLRRDAKPVKWNEESHRPTKEYFEASCKRFDQYKAQLNLFK